MIGDGEFEYEWAFFYNEEHNNVESVTTFHQLDCDMGSLAEAHPEVIYFYAEFSPAKEWDFNHVAVAPPLEAVTHSCSCHAPGRTGPCDLCKVMVTGCPVWEIPAKGPDHPPLFEYGVDHATLFTVPDMKIISIDIHEGPNAFGEFIEIVEPDAEPGTTQGE